jgi:DNA replication protein DnaC
MSTFAVVIITIRRYEVLLEETIQKLLELKLGTMAQTLRELVDAPPEQQLSWQERLGMIVDREWSERDNRRLARRLKDAKLGIKASLEDVICEPTRGLDKAQLRQFATCQWVRAHQNVILLGATGVGKSFLAAALAEAACRRGARALFSRVPRLVEELALARASGSYSRELARIAKIDVLVLDDFLIAPLKDAERRDLLEVLEDRYDHSCTIITSQVPTKTWHEALGDPTIADAICDRLIHNGHVIQLRGGSMRKRKALPISQTTQSTQ